VLYLIDDIKLGDTLLILGHTTDFIQPVYSMEEELQKISSAYPGMQIALKVMRPVRDGDLVYRLLVDQEAPGNAEIWALALEAQHRIARLYDPAFKQFMADTGLELAGVGLLLAALTFDPLTINPARLRVRSPYTSTRAYRDRLRVVAEMGYLEQAEPDDYFLSDLGKRQSSELIEASRERIAQGDPLSLDDSRRLEELFDRLVGCSLDTAPPPEPWSIGYSYKLMPGPEPPLPYIEQAISCLASYRDDAHLAAWRLGGLSAIAMESLTMLWRQECSSLEGLADRLQHRGHSFEQYQEALVELRQRGFIRGDDISLSLTEEGLAMRLRVETATDRYFYAPWSCLSAANRIDMACLLTQLRDQPGAA
jgi:hypothetical protein